jgi:uncharacterized protein YbbK (DUF523 family)
LKKVLVSACLLGERVRYDGRDAAAENAILREWCDQKLAVPICPEVAGGLAVPREPAEIETGSGEDVLNGIARVVTRTGEDVTDAFLKGAEKALEAARDCGASIAILKAKSPSCGTLFTYDGSFSGKLEPGVGVTAALLKRHGIAVFNEHQINEAALALAEGEP